MGTLLSYSILSGLVLSIGYLIYKWVMAGEKQHGYNRAMIYLIYAGSLMLPFAASGMRDFRMGSVAIDHDNAIVTVDVEGISAGVIDEAEIWPEVLIWIYIAGIVAVTLWGIIGVLNLLKVVKEADSVGEIRLSDGRKARILITPRADIAPFSWLRYIIMNREDYESAGNLIITHEKRHLELCHWIDLLISEAVLAIEWFNPSAWLLRDEFMTVHEFQADDAVMRSGADCRQYQMLLIKKAVGTRFQSLANSLNHSKLKKRVTMMYQKKSSNVRRMGALLLIPAMVAGVAAVRIPALASVLQKASDVSLTGESVRKVNEKNADNTRSEMKIGLPAATEPSATAAPAATEQPRSASDEKKTESGNNLTELAVVAHASAAASEPASDSKEKVYVAVDNSAEYPGGIGELMKYLAQNIRYPEEAMKSNTQGRVIVKFVIDKSGKVTSPEILKGVSPELDKEAIRVVESMPAWQPATVGGKPVSSWYNLPITYRLQNDDKTKTEGTATDAKAE